MNDPKERLGLTGYGVPAQPSRVNVPPDPCKILAAA
jgi:hypothetical protein